MTLLFSVWHDKRAAVVLHVCSNVMMAFYANN